MVFQCYLTPPHFFTGQFEKALIDAFLGFDKHLTEQTVINALKAIAGAKDDEEDGKYDPIVIFKNC